MIIHEKNKHAWDVVQGQWWIEKTDLEIIWIKYQNVMSGTDQHLENFNIKEAWGQMLLLLEYI